MVMTPTRAPTRAGQMPRPRPPRLYPTVMSNEEPTLFTVAQAAAQLGISPETLRTAARVGKLRVQRMNPRLNLVTPEAIEEYRRTHLGRQGRPKGARNKPKTPALVEGAAGDVAGMEPTREDRGGTTRAQKRRAPSPKPQQAKGKPGEPTARHGAPVEP